MLTGRKACGRTLKGMAFKHRIFAEGTGRLTNGIVQTQCLVPVPPLVPYSWILLHNQCGDAQVLQPCTKGQPALATSGDENVRLGAFELDLAVSRNLWVPRSSHFLRVVAEGLQVGVNGKPFPNTLRGQDEPEDAISGPPCPDGESEQGFDPCDIFVRFSNACGFELEILQTSLVADRAWVRDSILEEGSDLRYPEEGTKVPREGEDVPPESIGPEKV